MGNNMGGGSSKSAKVMKINGELFKLKTPSKVFDIIKDYPDHVLLDSEEFLRFNLRAKPLDLEDELKPKRIYLLVELPKFPISNNFEINPNNNRSPIRRVRSGVDPTITPIRDLMLMMTRRSVSDLSIMTSSMVARSSTDSDDGGSMDSPMGPTQVKVRLPKAQVERIMEESQDEVEISERILRLCMEESAVESGGDMAAPVAQGGGSGGELRQSENEAADVGRHHCFSFNVHPMWGPSASYHLFIFEIASPTKSSDYNLYSLPMIYGAKVNDLIMVGEWWRLVTPMFLHSGLLHIALSSWVLISFGPQVCKGYGGFTFLLIYILGGVSGNFTSFLHTSEPTVGGSGPVFAIIGAWLIYQMQNKDVAEKEVSESMFQKAIIATALSFVLGNFGPIDNWSNLGAAISGIVYGFFTSPVVQVDDVSPDASSSQERINKLIRQPANPFKSLIIFAVFLSFLTSLLFFAKSPLDTLELKELVQIAIE